MNTLPHASGTARMTTSGTQTTSLPKWKIVKNFSTSITVLRRFGVNCRIGTTWVEVQCNVSPESAVGSTQAQLEKKKPSENAATKSRIGRRETRTARGVCKELALDPLGFYPILRTFIGIQVLKDPPGEISITQLVVAIAVIVWSVTHKPSRKQMIFILSFNLMVNGVHAEDPTESRMPEDPNAWETHDYAETAAMTLLALVLTMGGAGVARRMCNRWRPLSANPVQIFVIAAPPAPAAPGVPAALVPAFDIMGGLTQSPVPTCGNPTYDILPELSDED